jgi:four helix bundle protein
VRDHRKLDAFALADNLVIEVYRLTAGFPDTERFGLVSQMRRGAVSVATNIVEGCARPSEKELIRFLGISFASVRELGYLLDLSTRLGYLDSNQAKNAIDLQGRTAAALSGLIRSFD